MALPNELDKLASMLDLQQAKQKADVSPSNEEGYLDPAGRAVREGRAGSKERRQSNKERRHSDRSKEGKPPKPPQKNSKKDRKGKRPRVPIQFDDPRRVAKFTKKSIVERTTAQKQVALFSHLPQFERESSLSLKVGFSSNEIHSAFLRLGLQFAEGIVTGSNARCVAMMNAFKQFIRDYQCPPHKVNPVSFPTHTVQAFSRDLEAKMKPLIRFLIDCRPQSIAMGNAIRYVKLQISKIPPSMAEQTAREQLLEKIDAFVFERIEMADQAIVSHALSKIRDSDVILTCGSSFVVELALKHAHDEGRAFTVIVVGSRPKQAEGKALLERLVEHGVSCKYILINSLSYVMQDVSKVFVGAMCVFANGAVVSRVGTSVVCMMAHEFAKPVMVCCETYKFHERTQLESFSYNELADPDDLIDIETEKENPLENWRDCPKLKLLNLVYDLTPCNFVDMVITEVGMIPPTSVPVILREYSQNTL